MNENVYNLELYDYSLRKELIAQYPLEKRDESRLLYYKKSTNEIFHHKFYEIINILDGNHVLVLNNTKVLPARFFVELDNGKKIEILLISSTSSDNLTWKVFGKPQKYLNLKSKIISPFEIEILDHEAIRFKRYDDLKKILHEIGQMPLPPYIKRESTDEDTSRYQTVFAKEPGAVAAPTASLHFTYELLEKLKEKGVDIVELTLHVGPGTFLPIRTDDIRNHNLMPEKYSIEKNTWEKIIEHKKNGKKIIACGTTVIRTLEYVNLNPDKLSGLNDLYISPGFNFKIVDGIITNFHLPKTSLLVLISAFLGFNKVKELYAEAIENHYRFFSYGDAMMVV